MKWNELGSMTLRFVASLTTISYVPAGTNQVAIASTIVNRNRIAKTWGSLNSLFTTGFAIAAASLID